MVVLDLYVKPDLCDGNNDVKNCNTSTNSCSTGSPSCGFSGTVLGLVMLGLIISIATVNMIYKRLQPKKLHSLKPKKLCILQPSLICKIQLENLF